MTSVADATWTSGSRPDDGWGPATPVRATSGAGSAEAAAPRIDHLGARARKAKPTNAGPLPPNLDPRSNAFDSAFYPQSTSAQSARERIEALTPTAPERGFAGWLALLVLVAVTFAGLLIDAARGVQLGTGFNVGIIAGSVIAILLVRRSGMFPVVVAPPIVYSLGAGLSLYVRSDGLAKRSVLIDAAANWLVYGFPAIAAATAAVLIIAGIRLIARR